MRDWVGNHWLAEHRTSAEEIADLLAVADRDLADAQVPGLSADGSLRMAYNAALMAATAALAAAGFRTAKGESSHYYVIQSLAFTIRAEAEEVDRLDRFRKKRNLSGYGRVGAVSSQEAGEMVRLAKDLRQDVEDWLRACHSGLMP